MRHQPLTFSFARMPIPVTLVMRLSSGFRSFPAILLVLSSCALTHANGESELEYRFPCPGAVHVSPSATIIFRMTARLDRSSLVRSWTVTAHGSRSGLHEGDLTLSDDDRTVIFQPRCAFLLRDLVHIRVQLHSVERLSVARGWEWTFTVRTDSPGDVSGSPSSWFTGGSPAGDPASRTANAVSATNDALPSDFPKIQVSINQNPSPSKIFFCPVLRTTPQHSYLAVLDEQFMPVYLLRKNGVLSDFKRQRQGLLTFFDPAARAIYGMNEAYAIVDSFRTGHGYAIDGHDIQVLPNGHALLMATVPNRQFREGYNCPAAFVYYLLQ